MLGRLELQVDCSFATERICGQGYLEELSLAGARLVAPPSVGRVGELLTLMIEPPQPHAPLGLTARIVRVDPIEEELAYGLHFGEVPPETRDELHALVVSLSRIRREPETAAAPLVELTCRDAAQCEMVFAGMAQGRLALRSADALALNAPLRLAVRTEDAPQRVELQSRVAQCQALPQGGYALQVAFAPVEPALLARMRQLVGVLMGLGVRQAVVEEE